MTAERYRAPLRQGARAAGHGHDGHILTHQLGLSVQIDFPAFQTETSGEHPDFAARAAIWRDHSRGLISFSEAQRRSAAVGIPPNSGTLPQGGRKPAARPRHSRPAPNESRQYAGDMATTAARDDRLTPNAKAFLQVLRARCGKGRETTITKGTAANIMARSMRTIRRYLVDLVRFGYIELETRANARGLHLGLTVRITDLVAPFYEEARGLARWLAERPEALFRPFDAVLSPLKPRVTLMRPKNQTQILNQSDPFGNADTGLTTARGKLLSRDRANVVPT